MLLFLFSAKEMVEKGGKTSEYKYSVNYVEYGVVVYHFIILFLFFLFVVFSSSFCLKILCLGCKVELLGASVKLFSSQLLFLDTFSFDLILSRLKEKPPRVATNISPIIIGVIIFLYVLRNSFNEGIVGMPSLALIDRL